MSTSNFFAQTWLLVSADRQEHLGLAWWYKTVGEPCILVVKAPSASVEGDRDQIEDGDYSIHAETLRRVYRTSYLSGVLEYSNLKVLMAACSMMGELDQNFFS